MRKEYKSPEMELVEMNNNDIITTPAIVPFFLFISSLSLSFHSIVAILYVWPLFALIITVATFLLTLHVISFDAVNKHLGSLVILNLILAVLLNSPVSPLYCLL